MSDQAISKAQAGYLEQLAKIGQKSPTLAAVLSRANANRLGRIAILEESVFADGLEELFQELAKERVLFASHPRLAQIAFIVGRITADYESAVEAFLAGCHSVVLDQMRAVMEAEYLLADFAADPTVIHEWLSLPERKRRNKYGPGALRARRASRIGRQPAELPAARDYQVHSQNLHLSPQVLWFAPRGFCAGKQELALLICLNEIFEHGVRFLQAASSLRARLRGAHNEGAHAAISSRQALYLALKTSKLPVDVCIDLARGVEEPVDFQFDLLEIVRGAAGIVKDQLCRRNEPGEDGNEPEEDASEHEPRPHKV
jgi:hypothetical protein